MKTSSLLLTVSLVANAALVAVFATRSASPESAAPAHSARPATSTAANAGHSRALQTALASGDTAALVAAGLPPEASAGHSRALQTALASGDIAALVAAGLSSEAARGITLARKLGALAAKAHAAQTASAADPKWWRSRSHSSGLTREQQVALRREISDALASVFGSDLGLDGNQAALLSFLPPAKRDALARVTQDYDEMMAKFGSAGGPQLASDKERLRLLRAERERDIAALLSPDEKFAYEMRTSATGTLVRSRYGDAIETEAEFQKIYALQKSFDEKFPREALTGRISPDVLAARAAAERQLDTDLRSSLGDDRYAALRRATDSDLRNVESLVTRLSLPATTTNTIAAARDTYAAESQRINSDPSVPFPQRRTQIQELAARAKSDVTRALGAEGSEAYAQSSQWLNLLQNGMAYSTTPQSGSTLALGTSAQSVFPVLPAGASTSGTTSRQVFISGVASPDGAVNLDRPAGANMQVMTFTSSLTETTAPAPAGSATLIVPAQPTAPASSTPAPKP